MEEKVGEALKRRLVPPWSLEYPTVSVYVTAGDWKMNYEPGFFITNAVTGRVVAIEVKSSISLSLPNIIKLQYIQTALMHVGTDFLLVVHSGSNNENGRNARLSEYGIHAVDVSGAVDAAGMIIKKLGA